MCVDFRALNQQINKDVYPIPGIEDLLDNLAHANWFSKMDLAQGITKYGLHQRTDRALHS